LHGERRTADGAGGQGTGWALSPVGGIQLGPYGSVLRLPRRQNSRGVIFVQVSGPVFFCIG